MFFRVVPNESNNQTLTTQQVERIVQFTKILMPHAYRQIEAKYGSGPFQSYARFVHYTSAESALKIIRSKRFWMRNVTCMADFTEVQRGFEIILRIFSEESYRIPFIKAFDACVAGVAEKALNYFEQSGIHLRFHTFITSISEHGDDEDINGRLSMWRAFGGNSGRVALVMKIPAVSTAHLKLKIHFSPVAYLTEEQTRDVVLKLHRMFGRIKRFYLLWNLPF